MDEEADLALLVSRDYGSMGALLTSQGPASAEDKPA
jgi:hypothetical protein